MTEDVLCSCYFKEGVNRQKTMFQGSEVSFHKALVLDVCSTPTPTPATATITTTTVPTSTCASSRAVPKWLTTAGILKQGEV